MSKNRYSARTDSNQPEIVKDLRKFGATVQTGMDDILVGYKGVTYWYEIKTPEAVSIKTGEVRQSELKGTQKELLRSWKGHYRVVWTTEQILDEINRH